MSWRAVVERGFVAVFGDPEVCRSACDAWWFRIDQMALEDLDVEGGDVRLADGSWVNFPRRPTTTRWTFPGEIFSDYDSEGVAYTGDPFAGLVSNFNALRTALNAGKSTGTGKVPVAVLLDGEPFADFSVQVIGVKANLSDIRATKTAATITVEVSEEGIPA